MPWILYINLTPAKDILEEETSIEKKMPWKEQLVGKYVGHLLNWWLMGNAQTIVGGAISGQVGSMRKKAEQIMGASQ